MSHQSTDPIKVDTSTVASGRQWRFLQSLSTGLEHSADGPTAASMVDRFARDRVVVVVTGTHGRGTVAGMLVSILEKALLDPTYILSAAPTHLDDAVYCGEGEVFVIDVDGEWSSLPTTGADMVICTFLERESEASGGHAQHLEGLLATTPRLRECFLNLDCRQNRALAARLPLRPTGYSLEHRTEFEGRWSARGESNRGCLSAFRRGSKLWDVDLEVEGEYNGLNALGAIAVARRLGIDDASMRRGLMAFRGLRPGRDIVTGGGVAVRGQRCATMAELKKVLRESEDAQAGMRWVVLGVGQPWREDAELDDGQLIVEGRGVPSGAELEDWLIERVQKGDQLWFVGEEGVNARADRVRARLAARAESTPEVGEQPRFDGPLND